MTNAAPTPWTVHQALGTNGKPAFQARRVDAQGRTWAATLVFAGSGSGRPFDPPSAASIAAAKAEAQAEADRLNARESK